jgi:maleate cis-trans isomerase
MRGWRAKVGVLVPEGNTTLEPELYALAPAGVSFHFARLQAGPQAITLEAIIRDYLASMPQAAEMVAKVDPALIVFGLTAGSFVPESGGNAGIEATITARTGRPALATGTCVIEGLQALGLRRLAEVTPYTPEVSAMSRRFLEAHGFQIALLHSIPGLQGVQEIYQLHPQRVYQEVKAALRGQQVDGVFLSGTGVPSLEIIPVLEADLGLPVVSSTIAVMWSVLRRLGIAAHPGSGRLLAAATFATTPGSL